MTGDNGQGGGTKLGTGDGMVMRSPSASVAAAQPSNVDPLLGQALAGRYHIERKLGEGGMGAVYIGRHMTLDKAVAVKVLHPEYARKPDLVERFLQEAKAASKIRHENVIDITDFGTTDDGMVFFCMEFLTGQDLHELITRAKLEGRRIPFERSAPIFLQICGALSAAHKAGVIHRDLKPENIFLIEWLGNPDFVKLLDFGIAKMTEVNDEEGRKLTKTGMLFGTPEYMSPEQARGEKPDHRVDVYAMGCILFQLITGDVPFAGESFMAVLAQHLTAAAPEIGVDALAAVGAPAALAPVIARALEKDRDLRYGTIDELADAVREACGGDVVSAEVEASRSRSGWRGSAVIPTAVPSAQTIPADGSKSNKALIAVAALAVVAIIAIAAVIVMGGGGDKEATAPGEPAEIKPAATQTDEGPAPGTDTPADKPEALVGSPATDKPATDNPAPDKPATENSATDKPAMDKPATDKPATDKPATDKPVATTNTDTKKPGTKKPIKKPDPPKGDSGEVKAGDVKTKSPFDKL